MIVVIGEALIDLIGRGGKQYEAVVGGANANVALALAVRGEKQAFLGRISKDGFGQLIRNHLLSNGVNLDYAVEAEEQTSLAVANIDSNGVANYSFYLNGTADWGWQREELPEVDVLKNIGVKAIQFGCLGMAIEPGSRVIEQWLREVSSSSNITLSHDLNIRPAVGLSRESERTRVEHINSLSDIVKASDADIEWLFEVDTETELDEIALRWSEGKLVLVTRGEKGVRAYFDKDVFDVPGFPVALVDTVGAGDTFMASFLAEMSALGYLGGNVSIASLSSEKLKKAIEVSNAAAAIVCERTGCEPPTEKEIRLRLENAR